MSKLLLHLSVLGPTCSDLRYPTFLTQKRAHDYSDGVPELYPSRDWFYASSIGSHDLVC